MKAFFITVCVCSVLMGAYCYFSPLPTMQTRYRCFFRYGTLHGLEDRSSTNCLSKVALADVPEEVAEQYQESVHDGNVMAEQYATAHILTVVLCGLLFGTGLVGLRSVKRRE
jgi:hypothetical protein